PVHTHVFVPHPPPTHLYPLSLHDALPIFSWRIGVEQTEVTDLVVNGAYAWVRNPVFTAVIATGAGLALMTPNPVALTALVALVIAIEIQVRAVEEPYLLRTHGQRYRDYAARTGRFVPRIGRLGTTTTSPNG